MKKDNVEANWQRYLGTMRRILKTFAQNQEADNAARLLDGRRGRGLRTFNIVPIHNFRAKYLFVDTSALHSILRSVLDNAHLPFQVPV